jgi:hypothetical protein
LKDLFSEERQKLIDLLLQDRLDNHLRQLGEWIKQESRTLLKMIDMGVAFPKPIAMALTLIQGEALEKALERAFSSDHSLEPLEVFFQRSQELGAPLDQEQIRQKIESRIKELIKEVKDYPVPGNLFTVFSRVIRLSAGYDVPLNLWTLQNSFLDACRDLPPDRPEFRKLYEAFGREIDIPTEVIRWELE